MAASSAYAHNLNNLPYQRPLSGIGQKCQDLYDRPKLAVGGRRWLEVVALTSVHAESTTYGHFEAAFGPEVGYFFLCSGYHILKKKMLISEQKTYTHECLPTQMYRAIWTVIRAK